MLAVVSGEEDVVGNVADEVLRVVADDSALVDVAGNIAAPCRCQRRWRLRVRRLAAIVEDGEVEVVVLALVLVRALVVLVLLEGLVLIAGGVVLWDPGAVLVGVAEVAGAPLRVPLPAGEGIPCARLDGKRGITPQRGRQEGTAVADLKDPFLAFSRHGRDRHPPVVQMPPPREVDIRSRHGLVVHVEPSCHAHGHVHSIAWTRRCLAWRCLARRCWRRWC
jgi:hypothetical protein